MYQVVEIHTLGDPALDPYARLTEAQLRNRRHPEQGLMIAEGAKVIAAALDAGCRPVSLLMERRQLEKHAALLERCGEVPVYTADREVLAGLTGYALTRGFLCAMRRPAARSVEAVCTGAARVAVLDGITDPTNAGALFRSAAALQMDAVLLSPACCDPLHRRALRVSMGTALQIPWARFEMTSAQWVQEGPRFLRTLGFASVALALDDRALSIADPALRAQPRLAILLGNEGDGLGPVTVSGCDYIARIPMRAGIDSLNVAAAGAVVFWELGGGEFRPSIPPAADPGNADTPQDLSVSD